MTLTELEYMVRYANRSGYKYFAVVVRNRDLTEIIINPIRNMYKKLDYYSQVYTHDMKHMANEDIQIIAAVYASDFKHIEDMTEGMLEVNKYE